MLNHPLSIFKYFVQSVPAVPSVTRCTSFTPQTGGGITLVPSALSEKRY
jgi:hypothetical protein